MRPESFEDATLVGDAKDQGVDVHRHDRPRRVHGLGAVRVLQREGRRASSPKSSHELAEDAGAAEVPSSGEGRSWRGSTQPSEVERGKDAELWVDSTKLHFFDPDSGANLGH